MLCICRLLNPAHYNGQLVRIRDAHGPLLAEDIGCSGECPEHALAGLQAQGIRGVVIPTTADDVTPASATTGRCRPGAHRSRAT